MAESEAVALTRFGLGAGEGDLERVAAVGARTWLTRQLEQPDPAVAARLANLPSSADRVLARDAMREGAGDEVREEVKAHVDALDVFSEGPRIASLIEGFAKAHPVVVKVAAPQEQPKRPAEPGRFVQPAVGRPVGVGFSSGRLNIRR